MLLCSAYLNSPNQNIFSLILLSEVSRPAVTSSMKPSTTPSQSHSFPGSGKSASATYKALVGYLVQISGL